MNNKTHSPYIHRLTQRQDYHIKWTKGFGGLYYLYTSSLPLGCLPTNFYFGERCAYITPGLDTYFDGGWRGNKSDDWVCHDFGSDMKEAIDWLHEADEPHLRTKILWTRNPEDW